MSKLVPVPELVNAERSAAAVDPPSNPTGKFPDYWHGSAWRHVEHWRARALAAEARLKVRS